MEDLIRSLDCVFNCKAKYDIYEREKTNSKEVGPYHLLRTFIVPSAFSYKKYPEKVSSKEKIWEEQMKKNRNIRKCTISETTNL